MPGKAATIISPQTFRRKRNKGKPMKKRIKGKKER